MKKRFTYAALVLLACSCPLAQGQNSVTDKGLRLLDECRTLYYQGDVEAAGTLLERWEKEYAGSTMTRTEEVEFLKIAVDATRHPEYTVEKMTKYMERYPMSVFYDQAMVIMGASDFENRNYENAIVCFENADDLKLDKRSLMKKKLQYGISLIRTGQVSAGETVLKELDDMVGDDMTYETDLAFYRAYADYHNGKLEQAANGFSQVLGTHHDEEARLYMADIALILDEDKGQAVQMVRNLQSVSKDQGLIAESNRILGESYFVQEKYSDALPLLSEYVTYSPKADRNTVYRLGMSQYYTGDCEAAVNTLFRVSEGEDELSQNAAYHAGLSALKIDDKEKARLAFERASSIKGSSSVREKAMYNLGMVVHETAYSPFAESVTVLERFLNEFPGSRYAENVNGLLVDAYLSTRNYDIALESIDKIYNPGNTILAAKQQLLFKKALDGFATGELDGVTRTLTDVIGMDKYGHDTAVEAYYWRGEAYFRSDKLEQAAIDYNRYLSLRRNNSANRSMAFYGLGYVYYLQGEYAKSKNHFRDCIETAVYNDLPKPVVIDSYLRSGDCSFYLKEYADAKSCYSKALNDNPSDGAYALYQIALVNGLERQYNEKIRNLNRIIDEYAESPYVPAALYELGRSYQQTDRNEQAIVAFRKITDNYRSSALARRALAEIALIYYQQDRYDDAIAAYKAVVDQYPGSEEAVTALADLRSIYLQRGDINSYFEFAQTAQDASPITSSEKDSLTYTVAENIYMRGDSRRALEAFSEYVTEHPNGAFAANAWYYQGEIYRKSNNYEKALQCYLKSADYSNSRFCEEALSKAADMAFATGDYETSLSTYTRLNAITTSVDKKQSCMYGIVCSADKLSETDVVLQYADKALETRLSPDRLNEIRFIKAGALVEKGKTSEAKTIFEALSADTRSAYGAESDYMLSQILYDEGKLDQAEKNIIEMTRQGSPHTYWLARSMVLLSDIYKAQGKDVEARQYLISLRQNYKGDDDIAQMISERLND